jgi:hypothetical protein
LLPWERTPSTHWIGGWMWLRVGMDKEAMRKNSFPLPQNSHPVCSQTAPADTRTVDIISVRDCQIRNEINTTISVRLHLTFGCLSVRCSA